MRLLLAALPLIALLAGCDGTAPEAPPAPQTLAVEGAWVRLPVVPGRPGAAYFTIKGGAAADQLTKIDADKVATIELHESAMDGGVMTMRRLPSVDVPAGGTVAFAPGGNHAMLFGIDPAVTPGATLPLRLTFGSGAVIAADAQVKAAGDDASAQGH